MITYRPATENDLDPAYNVFYQNELEEGETPPSPPDRASLELRHILSTGSMYVVEEEGQILGFASAITRGTITYLTDLFVLPTLQSGGLGKTLLQHVLPNDELIHCTISSTDPRAQALYIRAGMQPQYPNFNLRWQRHTLDGLAINNLEETSIKIMEGKAGDPAFVRWDARVSGRERTIDHEFWVTQQQAIPLWFIRGDVILGYAYIRLGVRTLWFPRICVVGPVGVDAPEDAAACVLAAVQWSQKRADAVRIDVPGPHPCLAPLLERGFHIVYVEQFFSSAQTPFFDPRCYISSGSDLL
jgi:ribosomal protein S18 acetylase RimI-like enzyme